MLKPNNSTAQAVKSRRLVSLSLPPDVEAHIKKMAKEGFRTWPREIEMRLMQSYLQDVKQMSGA